MKLRFLLLSLLLVTILQQAVAQINDDELYNKAVAYYEAKQYDMAAPIFEQLALMDHAKACNALGIIYFNGFIGYPDYQRGYDYLKRSAELGFEAAMVNLGHRFCYHNDYPGFHQWWEDQFGDEDLSYQAAKWYSMAAKGDGEWSSDGYYGLAVLCYFPMCDDSSWGYNKEGLFYLQKAAQLGNTKAMVALGIESPPHDGIEWLKRAKAEGVEKVIWWAGIENDVSIDDLIHVQSFCLKSNKWQIEDGGDCMGIYHIVQHSGCNLVALLSCIDSEKTQSIITVFSDNGEFLYSISSSDYDLHKAFFYDEDKNAWHFETPDGVKWVDLSGNKPRVLNP